MKHCENIQDELPYGIQLLEPGSDLAAILASQTYFAFHFHEGAARYVQSTNAVLSLFESGNAPCPPTLLTEKGGQLFMLPKHSFPPSVVNKIHDLHLSVPGNYLLTTRRKQDITMLFEKIKTACNTRYCHKELLLINYAVQLVHFMIKQRSSAPTRYSA